MNCQRAVGGHGDVRENDFCVSVGVHLSDFTQEINGFIQLESDFTPIRESDNEFRSHGRRPTVILTTYGGLGTRGGPVGATVAIGRVVVGGGDATFTSAARARGDSIVF